MDALREAAGFTVEDFHPLGKNLLKRFLKILPHSIYQPHEVLLRGVETSEESYATVFSHGVDR